MAKANHRVDVLKELEKLTAAAREVVSEKPHLSTEDLAESHNTTDGPPTTHVQVCAVDSASPVMISLTYVPIIL